MVVWCVFSMSGQHMELVGFLPIICSGCGNPLLFYNRQGGTHSDLGLPIAKLENPSGLPTISYNCHGQTVF